MALTRVQTTAKATATSTNSVSMTFATAPTVGNGVVVEVIARNNIFGLTLSPGGCTDNRGNTYTRAAVSTVGTTHGLAVYYCAAVVTATAPFTMTIASDAGTVWVAVAHEVSGVGSTGLVVDKTITNNGGSTSPSTGTTAALTNAEVFLVALHEGLATQASITVQSVSPAWTEDFEQLSDPNINGEGDSRVRTGVAATTQSCSWTLVSGTSWNAGLVAFAASGASGAAARADTFIVMPV